MTYVCNIKNYYNSKSDDCYILFLEIAYLGCGTIYLDIQILQIRNWHVFIPFQGKLIGICGPVGSGKSSMVAAILSRVIYIYLCPLSFAHWVVCSSLIYGFRLPLWYHQTLHIYYLATSGVIVKPDLSKLCRKFCPLKDLWNKKKKWWSTNIQYQQNEQSSLIINTRNEGVNLLT